MRVYLLYTTVLFIAKAAIALGSQDSSIKDVARHDHLRLKREDFVRYPKRLVHLKGRGRYYNGDSQYDSPKPVFYVPIVNKRRFVKNRRKMPSLAEDFVESTSQGAQGNAKSKINWNEIVQEINTLSKTTQKDQPDVKNEGSDQSPAAYVISIANPQGGKISEKAGRRNVYQANKPVCDCPGPCTCPKPPSPKPCGCPGPCSCPPVVGPSDCPNSVETVFQCPKCRTHYIVRLNMRESKCGQCQLRAQKMLKRQTLKGTDLGKMNTRKVCGCPEPCSCPRLPKPCGCPGPCSCPPIIGPSDCPNSVETMFQCPKCRTHYIVRLNMRESKCGQCGPAPPSCSKTDEAISPLARIRHEMRQSRHRN